MPDSQQANELSWVGILSIIGLVGLNTAFTLRTQARDSASVLAVLPDYAVHVGLGLLVTGVIVYHQRLWTGSE